MNECFHMCSVFQWSQSRPLDNSGIGGRSNVIWNENWIQWMLAPAAKSSTRCRHVHIEVCCWPRCTLCPQPSTMIVQMSIGFLGIFKPRIDCISSNEYFLLRLLLWKPCCVFTYFSSTDFVEKKATCRPSSQMCGLFLRKICAPQK